MLKEFDKKNKNKKEVFFNIAVMGEYLAQQFTE